MSYVLLLTVTHEELLTKISMLFSVLVLLVVAARGRHESLLRLHGAGGVL